MRIRRESAALRQFAPEVGELLRRHPALDKRTGVDAGRGVTLEVNNVAVVAIAPAAEEVVETDLIQGGSGREGGNVAADAVLEFVGLDHHRQRIPAHEALDAELDLTTARNR